MQNGESSLDLLLSVTNRKALALGWGVCVCEGGAPQPHRAPFKTLITLLLVTFSQHDPQLGVGWGKRFYLLTDVLNCLTVKYLASWHLE